MLRSLDQQTPATSHPSPISLSQAQKETCGKVLEDVFSDIFMNGAKPISNYESDRVDQVIKHMRIDADVALEILSAVSVPGHGLTVLDIRSMLVIACE